MLEYPDVLQFPDATIKAGSVLVAEHDGVPVGFASVEMGGDDTAELINLFVEPMSWRRGIGRRLVAAALDRTRENGTGSLMVAGSSHSEGFCRACGFQTVGAVETRSAPGVRMRRPIGATDL